MMVNKDLNDNIYTYNSAFELYKRTTQEKENIASIIRSYVPINSVTKVLDIGSAQGVVVKMVQPNLENITMIDIIDQDVAPCTYIKKPFEEIKSEELENKYDLVIASHVWGHFYHNHSAEKSLVKMCDALKDDGHLVIISNTNSGFFGELGIYIESILPESQINQFHELTEYTGEWYFKYINTNYRLNNVRELYFNTHVKMQDMNQLTDLCRIFFVNDDKEYTKKRDQIKNYLDTKLAFPEICIEQIALIMQVKK